MEIKKYSDENYVNEIFQKIYPIGSIYLSTVSTNPNSLFGFGTWEQIQDRFLLAAGNSYAAGSTGGETEHTLTVDEIPSHTHQCILAHGSNDPASGFSYANTVAGTFNFGFIKNTGGSGAHNNMPPYLVVYVWKRVS